MRETNHYDAKEDVLYVQTDYDPTAVIEANKAAQNASANIGRYKGNLVHVGRIHEGDILRLKNMGYDVLSADPDEYRRALCYIQSHEPHLLTVPGRPFALIRNKWI